MTKSFSAELVHVKKQYQEAIELVTEASKNLGGLFSQKMLKIKSKLLKYFADTDRRIEDT
jgi:hypothetical protein